jgi:uncharacterized protein (DUF697 family)
MNTSLQHYAPEKVQQVVSAPEAAACLRVLVFFAKSSGPLTQNERTVLEQEWDRLVLPPETTLSDLIGENINLEQQLAVIQSEEGRERTYNAVYLLAHVDGPCSAAQQGLLARVCTGLKIPKEKMTPLGRVYWEAREFVFPSAGQPISDPVKRNARVYDEILKYSLINAVSGAFPIPVLSIATDLIVISTQTVMVRDIGRYWGHSVDRHAARSLMASVLGATSMRIAIHSLLNVVPVLGSAVGAGTAFASTWALGRAADKYFESGGKLDAQTLRNFYQQALSDAQFVYEKSKDVIATRVRSRAVTLELLNEELASGRITRDEYDRKIAGMQ